MTYIKENKLWPAQQQQFVSKSFQSPCSSFKSLQSSEKIPLFETEYKFCDLGLIKNIATCILKYTTISYVIYDWGGVRPLRPLVNKISSFSLIKNIQNKNFIIKTKIPFKVFCYTSMVRYALQRILMIPLYPAQSLLFREIFSPHLKLRSNDLDIKRAAIIARNNSEGFIYKEISIRKNGIEYNGIMAYRPQYPENGNWVLQATGNAEPIEYSIENVSRIYDAIEFNTLMINGPYVGKSNGEATPDSMGDAQEAGLCYLYHS